MSNLLEKASILTTGTAYDDGKLLSVKPTNVLGNELVTNGDFATDSDWSKDNSWSISGGKANYLYISNRNMNSQSATLVVGRAYKLVYTILDYVSGNVQNNSASSQTSNSSNGTYTEYFVARFSFLRFRGSTNGNLSIDNVSVKEVTDGDFDFTRGSTATRVNSSGLIEDVASGLPRIDYTDGVGSILLEPQSTNLVTYSEDFTSNSNYSTNAPSGIFESGYLAPDGTNTATRINGFDGYYLLLSNLGSADIRSMYVKSGNGQTGNVNLLDRNNHTSSLFEVTSEWKRIELVGVDSAFYIVDGRGANITLDDIIIWGLQQENLSYATSYIPTNGQINGVTRLAETLNNSGSSDLINSTEGVLYVETKASVHNGNITLSNGGNNDNLIISFNLNSGRIDCNMKVGGAYQFIFNYTTDMSLSHKIAVRYKANDFALFVDGTKVLTDTSGITATSGTLNELNFAAANQLSKFFYGNTKCVAVFKEALTDAELTCLTTI